MHHSPDPARPGPQPSGPAAARPSRLLTLILLAILPLGVTVWLQALATGRPGAILAALLASCAGVLLALLAARAADRLQARLQQAQAALVAREQSITRLAHELRNPVGAICAAVDVLQSAAADSDTAVEARSIIARQVRVLSDRINELPRAGSSPASEIRADPLPQHRRCQVLVVQADEDLRATLRSRLELDGHAVSSAASGPEGLARLLALRPDVSIVDLGLPGASGYELARNARAAGYAGRMIALSGAGQQQDVASARTAGFDACLVEPLDRLQLRASLNDA